VHVENGHPLRLSDGDSPAEAASPTIGLDAFHPVKASDPFDFNAVTVLSIGIGKEAATRRSRRGSAEGRPADAW
jgi:hypothetical protein